LNSEEEYNRKIFCFDIDGVIATITPENQYNMAQPIHETIDLINSLFDQEHQIILFTARGSATGINWEKTTAEQIKTWGVKYHKLLFGKPAADYYIDDKLVSIDQLKSLTNEWSKK